MGAARSGRSAIAGAVLIVAAALAAYHNSFSGRFVFDDGPSIADNPTIRHLWDLGTVLSPPSGGYTVSGRPIVNLTLAINYALGGMNVWGYHALNLLIHTLAGLTLFGIARRTLARMGYANATSLGFCIALIWTVHPLQTESVTYIIQRAESLMGLFYLLTLYLFIRSVESEGSTQVSGFRSQVSAKSGFRSQVSEECPQPSAKMFRVFSVASCLCCVATKEVSATLPIIVLLYDRTFVSGSFREALRRRGFYLGLALTWLVLAWLALGTGSRGQTAGANLGMDLGGYWLTQFRAIAHYLRLSAWPRNLVLDYGTDLVASAAEIIPAIALVVALAAGTVVCLFRDGVRPPEVKNSTFFSCGGLTPCSGIRALGFAGTFFFAILAPTSLVPVVVQVMAEHRMYLALAPVVSVAVVGGYALFRRLLPQRREPAGAARAWLVICGAAAVCLGLATVRRNEDYRTELSLWGRTAAASPANSRAQYNIGLALSTAGDFPAAIEHYRKALRITPDYTEAHNNLAIALTQVGRWQEAIAEYEKAATLEPDVGRTRYNLGNAFLHEGRLAEAVASYQEAGRLAPDDVNIPYNLALALARQERYGEAAAAYRKALGIDPGLWKASDALAHLLVSMGRPDEAIAAYEDAIRASPNLAEAQDRLGHALALAGRFPDAVAAFRRALQIKPDLPGTHNTLGMTLVRLGQTSQAVDEFSEAARLQPANSEILNNLGCALAQLGRFAEARTQFEAALRISPSDAQVRDNLARLPPTPTAR